MKNNKLNNEQVIYCDSFSCYANGYKNHAGIAVLQTKPNGVMNITQLFEYIKGDVAKETTASLRHLIAQRQNPDETTKEENEHEQEFKKLNFMIITVGGIFNYRNASGIKERSIFRAVDIDDLDSEDEARKIMAMITKDTFLKSALCFLSPRGLGVKNIIEIPKKWRELPNKKIFELITQHYQFHYGIFIDQSGSDISRATYLCHDPECYINPDYLHKKENNNED